MSELAVIGQGLAAHALAALWPTPLRWDVPETPTATHSHPLLIHASNAWLWQHITIPMHPIHTFSVHGNGFSQSWNSQDFQLQAFAWMVDAGDILCALQQCARARSLPFQPSPWCLIATGSSIPPQVPFQEYPGKAFHTQIQDRPDAQQHTLRLHWAEDGSSSAILPQSAFHSTTITTQHPRDASHPQRNSYHRRFLHPQHLALGDSLMVLPPTLAAGFNTLLQMLRYRMLHAPHWQEFKTYTENKAQQQFLRNHRYHKLLSQPCLRGLLYASLRKPLTMHYLIAETLYGH